MTAPRPTDCHTYLHCMRKTILNKYRNELGRLHRKEYESGVRNGWCRRSGMRSYQCRPDRKSGTVVTFIQDNLVMEIYEN
jgi:hypothetical protein